MTVTPPNEYLLELIKSFGLDIKKMVQFKLIINPDEVVRIEVLMLPSEEDIKAGNLGVKKLMKEYVLVEKKEEQNLEEIYKGLDKDSETNL